VGWRERGVVNYLIFGEEREQEGKTETMDVGEERQTRLGKRQI